MTTSQESEKKGAIYNFTKVKCVRKKAETLTLR